MLSVILIKFAGWTLLFQPSRRLQLETGLFKLIAISVRLVEASILFSLSEKKLLLYWNVHKKYLWKKFYLWMLLIWIVYLQYRDATKYQSVSLLNASQYGVGIFRWRCMEAYCFVMRLRKFQFPKTVFIIRNAYLGLTSRYSICNSLSLRIISYLENIAYIVLCCFLLLFNLLGKSTVIDM